MALAGGIPERFKAISGGRESFRSKVGSTLLVQLAGLVLAVVQGAIIARWLGPAGKGVFAGLPNPFEATRYHSLVIERASFPEVLEITAWTDDGEIMGVRHKTLAVHGVQFHPESILTEHGHDMLRNFLSGAK